jgi:hypothetical protein
MTSRARRCRFVSLPERKGSTRPQTLSPRSRLGRSSCAGRTGSGTSASRAARQECALRSMMGPSCSPATRPPGRKPGAPRRSETPRLFRSTLSASMVALRFTSVSLEKGSPAACGHLVRRRPLIRCGLRWRVSSRVAWHASRAAAAWWQTQTRPRTTLNRPGVRGDSWPWRIKDGVNATRTYVWEADDPPVFA